MRFRYLDLSRCLLLALGIVLHAAWLYRGDSQILSGTHEFIHSFRMEAFFILAGFFSGLMLEKYSPGEFLARRLTRLGLPLLLFGIIDQLVNCEDVANWRDLSPMLDWNYWTHAKWLQHLWFLSVLTQYIAALAVAARFFPRGLEKLGRLKLTIPGLFALASAGYVGLHIPDSVTVPFGNLFFV